jgi:hypothetical protein
MEKRLLMNPAASSFKWYLFNRSPEIQPPQKLLNRYWEIVCVYFHEYVSEMGASQIPCVITSSSSLDGSATSFAMIRFIVYTIDQGSPCPLATLNPFGRELLLSDVSTGIK